MNSPADFDALTCSRKKKGEIAMMVAVWNTSIDAGRFTTTGYRDCFGHTSYTAKARTAARKLGLLAGKASWQR